MVFEITPMSRAYVKSYSVTVFELLDAEEYHHLEIYFRSRSRSLEMAPLDRFPLPDTDTHYWQFSVGVNQGGNRASDQEGRLTGDRWRGRLDPGYTFGVGLCRTIAIEQHFDCCLFKLLLTKNI